MKDGKDGYTRWHVPKGLVLRKKKAQNYLRLIEIHIYKDNKNNILTMFSVIKVHVSLHG